MTHGLRSALVRDVARAIHGHAHVIQRKYHLDARQWDELEPAAQECYFGMAQAALAAIRGHTLTFAPLNLGERIKAAWQRFVKMNWVKDGPQDESPFHLRDKYPNDPEVGNPANRQGLAGR